MFHTHAKKQVTIEEHKVIHENLYKCLTDCLAQFSIDVLNNYPDNPEASISDFSLKDFLAWGSDKVHTEEDESFKELFSKIDELAADWVLHQADRNGVILGRTNVTTFISWSSNEAQEPTDITYLPENHVPLTEDKQQEILQKEAEQNTARMIQASRIRGSKHGS